MKPLGRSRLRWEDNIKMDLQDVEQGVWTGKVWPSLGTSGGPLRTRPWTFVFYKVQGIS
jgi:hypothetical protein